MDGGLLGHRLEPVEMEQPMKAIVRTGAAAGSVPIRAGRRTTMAGPARGRNYTAPGISTVRAQLGGAVILEAGTASDNLTLGGD